MPRKLSHAIVIAIAVLCGSIFYPERTRAADFTGGPCVVGSTCTLSRAVNVAYPGKTAYALALDGVLVACQYSSASPLYPSFSWVLDVSAAAATSWTITAYDSVCGGAGALLRDSGSNPWDGVTLVTTPEGIAQSSFEASLPSISWGYSTDTGNGTTSHLMENHLAAVLGAATNTFPVCLSYSWLTFYDQLVGITTGELSPQTFVFRLPIASGTPLTLDLRRMTVTSSTTFSLIVSNISNFLLAVGWLIFGAFVFKKIFFPHHTEDV